MTATPPDPSAGGGAPVVEIRPVVDIVVPVRDEERALDPAVRRLHAFLREEFPWRARIVIADNGSHDHTWAVASTLAAELDTVRAVRLTAAGRGARCTRSGRTATPTSSPTPTSTSRPTCTRCSLSWRR